MNLTVKIIPILSFAIIFLFVPQIDTHAGDKEIEPTNQMPEEQPITIRVQNEPLSQVLDKIGNETGITFSVDVQWKTYPVSVSLYKTPLHKGLKRILANLNNVIIYESNNKVKIVILGKIETGKKTPRYQPTPVYKQPGPAAAPKSEPEQPEEAEEAPESETEADEKSVGAPAAEAPDSDEKEESDETQTDETKEETEESENPEENSTSTE